MIFPVDRDHGLVSFTISPQEDRRLFRAGGSEDERPFPYLPSFEKNMIAGRERVVSYLGKRLPRGGERRAGIVVITMRGIYIIVGTI
jgi:hypothetical protein